MGDAGVHFAQQNDRTKTRICQLRIGNAKRREISCINTKYEIRRFWEGWFWFFDASIHYISSFRGGE